jgi:uncharacterized protein
LSNLRSWQSWIQFIVVRGALIYLGLALLLALLQRHLIYFPSRLREEQLLRQAERDGLHPWRDRDNQLIGWRSSPPDKVPQSRNRLVVFHGNAGYALHRSYYVNGFHRNPESTAVWELFLFEYPGYGSRPGSPSESSILTAARRAITELLRDDSRPIFLLGESLGSSFAAALAAEYPQSISGLFLVTPLTCMTDVASSHYKFLPVRLMLREHHDVRALLNNFPGPIAFLIAGRDEVMANGLGEKLYKQYAGNKKLWIQPYAGHNTLDFTPGALWWQEVEFFLQKSLNKFSGIETRADR